MRGVAHYKHIPPPPLQFVVDMYVVEERWIWITLLCSCDNDFNDYDDNQSEIIHQPWLGLNTIDTSVLYVHISISSRGFILKCFTTDIFVSKGQRSLALHRPVKWQKPPSLETACK